MYRVADEGLDREVHPGPIPGSLTDRDTSGVLCPVTNDRPRRYHSAFALEREKGGYKVSHVLDFASRGQADKWSLGLLAEHGDAGSITLERELVNGEVLDAAALKR